MIEGAGNPRRRTGVAAKNLRGKTRGRFIPTFDILPRVV
jgi:hypothetical protein